MEQLIYTILAENHIRYFLYAAYENYITLGKEYGEIVSQNYSLEEITLAIDSALECIKDWNLIIESSSELTKNIAHIEWEENQKTAISQCRKDMLYLRGIYEELRENDNFYNKKFSIIPQKKIIEKLQYSHGISLRTAIYDSSIYCIEMDYMAEYNLDKLIRNIEFDWLKCRNYFVYHNSGTNPIPATCICISFKYPTSLREVSKLFTNSTIYQGHDCSAFYNKYISADYGPKFKPMLTNHDLKVNVGEKYFYAEYPKF